MQLNNENLSNQVGPLLSIIVPTYNEADNIIHLIYRIEKVLTKSIDYEVIVVDDDSPDGTALVASNLGENYPVRVILRKDVRGLASAVVRGFDCSKAQMLIVIDADLQHPPETIPLLVRQICNGADIAISSRYALGGGMEKWRITRRFISKFATILTKIMLAKTRDVSDPLSGFFAVTKKTVEDVRLRPIGYKILLEVLALGRYNTVSEIPYTFYERVEGKTKYNTKEVINFLHHLISLGWRTGEITRIFKFILVGAIGIVINEGLLYLLTNQVGLFYLLSSVIAVQIAILNNFVWNHLWTFHDRRTIKDSVWYKLAKFELVSIGGKLANILVLYLMVAFLDVHYLIANLFGIAAGFVINFLLNNIWTWRK